jgi:superoxide dismutase
MPTCAAGSSPLLGQLARLIRESNAFAADADDATGTGATEIDLEEQAAGYQAAYSKLATAGTLARDVVAYAGDVRVHVVREFTRLLGAEPGMKTLAGMAEGPFFPSLGSVEGFKKQFNAATVGIQGSGWGWLVYNPSTEDPRDCHQPKSESSSQ